MANNNFNPGKWISILLRYNHIWLNNRLIKFDISAHQYAVVLYTLRHEPVCQENIVKELKLDKATITRIVQALVKTGYLTTILSKHDKRFKEVRVTDKLKRIEPELLEISEELNSILMKGLDSEEVECITRSLKTMGQNIFEVIRKQKK